MINRILTVVIIIFSSALIPLIGQINYVNIEQFKVSGADENDDTQEFDQAIEYISKKGGILFIPKGNYYLDNNKRTRKGVYNNNYIFILNSNFKIILDKAAILHYRNGFKGFRFRSTRDPNDNTINRFSIEISGGQIDGSKNLEKKILNNPQIWGIVGETLEKFKVTGLHIKNLKATAGIASYSNNYANISNNTLTNVTGNPFDLIDNHGDGIYIANTISYDVNNNIIINNITNYNRIGRIGICIEYERSRNGNIIENNVSGYDRGVHIELIKGTAFISKNVLKGNSSGVVLWNNYGKKQIISYNKIYNTGLKKENKPILYTSAPILLLEFNTNTGSEIKNNTITIDKEFFVPANLLQITSNDVVIKDNIFNDESQTLSLSIAQGQNKNRRVNNIQFINNNVSCKHLMVYDGMNIRVENNSLNAENIILSFDQSTNYFRNNRLKNGVRPVIYGNYRK